jgi:hypothetical protein
MDWKEAMRQWRALPEEEQQRRRRASIPRKVARSMAFDGEPVDQTTLEAEHARLHATADRPDTDVKRKEQTE